MTNKELFRLEEIAGQIKNFYDYPVQSCMDTNLEDFYQEARKAILERSRELWQKLYKDAIVLLDIHFEMKCWLKDAVNEFKYWSSRNTSIANIILEYLGMLGEIYRAVEGLKPPLEPYKGYIESLENRVNSLSTLLFSPEIEKKGKYLSDKLYGIYYAEILLQKDEGYAGIETLYEQFGGLPEENAGQADSVTTENDSFLSLRDCELRTLDAMIRAYPEILTLDAIEKVTKRTRNTVCVALKKLREYGFVTKNESGNNVVTKAGKEFFEKHF